MNEDPFAGVGPPDFSDYNMDLTAVVVVLGLFFLVALVVLCFGDRR